MPYYISDEADGCDGWATVKDDGEVMGCHSTKQDAIDQAVAIALAEDSEFLGERMLEARELPENYRPATSDDVPEGRACGNCVFYNEDRVNEDGVRVWCERWADWVRGDHYCNAWQPDDEDRQVDLDPPGYIREAARQGLEYHAEGLSGDGVVDRTVREARLMADGQISEDKVVRVSAWAARHRVDLDAEGARPGEDGYPTPGAVAHLLWGIPTGGRYSDAVAWFDRKSEQVKADRSTGMQITPVKPRTEGSGVEFRSFEGEIRSEGDGNTFVGYAAVFNSDSEPLPFVERILPGAFSKSLRNRKRDIRLYVNHDSNMVLASRRSGTLMLSEDDRGLRVEATLPDTTAGRDIRELLRTNVVDKMSFGFQIPRGGDRWSEDGRTRELREIMLHEVSVVTGFPAYEATTAAVRSLERLSERTGIAVDELSDTLEALAAGEQVDPSKAKAIASLVEGASVEEPGPDPMIGLLQKQHDLLAKKW